MVALLIGLFFLALWVVYKIVVGAAVGWEKYGPLVLVGWIFFFPIMLFVSLVVGVTVTSESSSGKLGPSWQHLPSLSAFGSEFDAQQIEETWSKIEANKARYLCPVRLRLGGYCFVPSPAYVRLVQEELTTSRGKIASNLALLAKPDHDFIFKKNWENQIGKGLFIGIYRTDSAIWSTSASAQAEEGKGYLDYLEREDPNAKRLTAEYGSLKVTSDETRLVQWFKYYGDSYFEVMLRTRFTDTDTWILNVQIGERLSEDEKRMCKELLPVMFGVMATLVPAERTSPFTA